MISVWGIQHGMIRKGIPKGLLKVAEGAKYSATRDKPAVRYAAERLAAHKQGRLAAIHPTQASNPMSAGNPLQAGKSARRFSRNTLTHAVAGRPYASQMYNRGGGVYGVPAHYTKR